MYGAERSVQYFPRLAFLSFIFNFILSCFFLHLKVYANEAERKQWRHERFAYTLGYTKPFEKCMGFLNSSEYGLKPITKFSIMTLILFNSQPNLRWNEYCGSLGQLVCLAIGWNDNCGSLGRPICLAIGWNDKCGSLGRPICLAIGWNDNCGSLGRPICLAIGWNDKCGSLGRPICLAIGWKLVGS